MAQTTPSSHQSPQTASSSRDGVLSPAGDQVRTLLSPQSCTPPDIIPTASDGAPPSNDGIDAFFKMLQGEPDAADDESDDAIRKRTLFTTCTREILLIHTAEKKATQEEEQAMADLQKSFLQNLPANLDDVDAERSAQLLDNISQLDTRTRRYIDIVDKFYTMLSETGMSEEDACARCVWIPDIISEAKAYLRWAWDTLNKLNEIIYTMSPSRQGALFVTLDIFLCTYPEVDHHVVYHVFIPAFLAEKPKIHAFAQRIAPMVALDITNMLRGFGDPDPLDELIRASGGIMKLFPEIRFFVDHLTHCHTMLGYLSRNLEMQQGKFGDIYEKSKLEFERHMQEIYSHIHETLLPLIPQTIELCERAPWDRLRTTADRLRMLLKKFSKA